MSEPRDTSEPGLESELEPAPDRQTLPPGLPSLPPASATALVGVWLSQADGAPLPRRAGARAEQAWLRARLLRARADSDLETERAVSVQLARGLAARGSELDTATRLARRALVLGEDPQLREELSGWFAGLGEPGLAAATLRPAALERHAEQAALVLTRIAVLEARAGSPGSAVDALQEASQLASSDPVILELLGAIGAWAPEALPAARAADAYIEGARRRDARGERAPAFEDLLRAFELDPGSAIAAELLAHALSARGRSGAADEVMREHALARPRGAESTHLRRLRGALAEGDLPRALTAGLDAGLDAEVDPEAALRAVSAGGDSQALGFDSALARAGLHELLAARLQLALEAETGPRRAQLGLALGRVYAGPLSSPDRAIEAWITALVADPASEDAKAALRSHASATRDQAPLVEALVRVGRGARDAEPAMRPAAEACLRELMVMAEQRLSDPSLASWALERLAEIAPDPDLDRLRDRLRPRARLQQEATDNARAALSVATPDTRAQALRRVLAALRFRPDSSAELIRVLTELAALEPDERGWRGELERLLEREERFDELTLSLTEQAASSSRADSERARLRLAALARAKGDPMQALRQLEPSLASGAGQRAAWCMALMLAGRVGSQTVRARALERLAQPLPRNFRAVLLCAASDAWVQAGDLDAAWAAARSAREADPSSARAATALASCALERGDLEAAPAIEHAVGVVVPRSRWCRALAEILERGGELPASLAWTQRWLALRPGDGEAARALLRRVTQSGSADRLADALGWLLSQAQPAGALLEPLAGALVRLSELDQSRAGALARRALDLFGPRSEPLRRAILLVADSLGERGLGIAVRERELAGGAPGARRPELLLEVFDRRSQAGDADGAARCLVRALNEGTDPGLVLDRVEHALPPRGSDGEIALLEARAEALSAQSGQAALPTVRAWRELGAALWDLASDHDGAIAAWERAALLDSSHGITTFARDLLSFAGQEACVQRVRQFAERINQPAQRARALSVAADVALKAGDAEQALELALLSLELDPRRSEVLAVAERAAGTSEHGVEALEQAYERVAQAALGCYGERAVHYRAAKNMERRGEMRLALAHAVHAFEAVPAPGVTFVQMVRLAERAGEPLAALSALERVAAGSGNENESRAWLERAAMFSGSGEQGQRQRLEVLLRALAVRPEADTLKSLGETLHGLMQFVPQELDVFELRLGRAFSGLLGKLEAEDGVGLALSAAEAALSGIGRASLAWRAISAATAVSRGAPGYEALLPHASALAEAPECDGWLAEAAQAPQASGAELLAFASALASEREEPELAARLLVEAFLREPGRADLSRRAEAAIRLLPSDQQAKLSARLLDARSPEERLEGLLQLAQLQLSRKEPLAARDTLEQARALPDASVRLKLSALLLLKQVYSELGQRDALAQLLSELVAEPECPASERRMLIREQAALLAMRGDTDAALRLLTEASQAAPEELVLLEDLLAIAQQAGEIRTQLLALRALSEQDQDLAVRGVALRGLAQLLEAEGDLQGARSVWQQVLDASPGDGEALLAQQRVAEAQADWEGVSQLLALRADASGTSGARALRLSRVQVLDQQLGRPDEARAELEAMLAAGGEDLEVIGALARLHEQLGDQLRAAPLWLRASALAEERARAAQLMRAACEAYLAGGDVEGARRVLEGMEVWVQSEEVRRLRVEVERRSQNPLALAEALEELALSSMASPAERASLLVESAQASERGGDVKLALARAQRAARIASDVAEPQLFARYLEYRTRGAGGREDARVTLGELRNIAQALEPEQVELRAFLLAEALDALGEPDGAIRELQRAHAEVGALPLIGLGLGERLSRRKEAERSLAFFDAAVDGDLRGLRRVGDVALLAADAALAANELEHASRFLELAAAWPESRAAALLGQVELRRAKSPSAEPELDDGAGDPRLSTPRGAERQQSESPAGERAGEEPTPSSNRVSANPLPREEPGFEVIREEVVAGALSGAPPGSERPAIAPPPSELPRARAGSHLPTSEQRPTASPSEASPHQSSPTESHGADSDSPAGPAADGFGAAEASSARSPSSAPPGSTLLRAATAEDKQPLSQEWRRSARSFAPQGQQEADLLVALESGSVEAGKELIRQLQNRADRAQDLVTACRLVSTLIPGDRWTLERMYEAALADKNFGYARAIEHVLGAFAGERIAPPELETQLEQPERVHRMLFGEGTGAAAEALALVWEGAQHVFRRDPSSYGVTGVERVPLHAPTALAKAYAGAARLLGSTRTPLFQRRSAGTVTLSVALISPPAIILSGDVPQVSAELAFHLGAMLGATLPQYVLLFGSTESQARSILKGLGLAFGPPRSTGAGIASAATLAEVLWESIPARSQRRLRELCDLPEALDYDLAMSAARLAIRRAGLFVAGDARVAVMEACAEEGIGTKGIEAPGGLAALCAASPAVSDLVLLATSPEYADARWRSPSTGRRRPTWSTF